MRTISKSAWIGAEGRAFQRVSQAFNNLGYVQPKQDRDSGGAEAGGAYVANIASQYYPSLLAYEVLAIIRYGLAHPLATLQLDGRMGGRRLGEIVSVYGTAERVS